MPKKELSPQATRKIIGIGMPIFFIFGLIILILNSYWLIGDYARSINYLQTEGRISKHIAAVKTKPGERSKTFYTPVVEYNAGGKTYSVALSISSELNPVSGQAVKLRYNPGNPEEFIVLSSLSNANVFLIFFGFMWCAISALIFLSEFGTSKTAFLQYYLVLVIFGGFGAGAYAYIGNAAGTFNPFKMLSYSIWSFLPMLFIAIFCLAVGSNIVSAVKKVFINKEKY